MGIGEKIRTLRKQMGISPEKLGMLCDISGQYIRKLEKDHNYSITLKTAERIAKGLGIPVSALIDRPEIPQKVLDGIHDKEIIAFFNDGYKRMNSEEKEFFFDCIRAIEALVHTRNCKSK